MAIRLRRTARRSYYAICLTLLIRATTNVDSRLTHDRPEYERPETFSPESDRPESYRPELDRPELNRPESYNSEFEHRYRRNDFNSEEFSKQGLSNFDMPFEEMDGFVKRQSSSGSCTCTCETKPVQLSKPSHRGDSSSESKQMQQSEFGTASLMRTEAKATSSASGMKSNDHGSHDEEEKKSNISSISSSSGGGSNNKIKSKPSDSDDIGKSKQPGQTNDVLNPDQTDKSNRQQDGHNSVAWVQGSRYPWKYMQDRMCYRDPCRSERDCCQRFNLCDKSAKVCVDCWHGSTCTSERDCCMKYPYCQRVWRKGLDGQMYVDNGKCVGQLDPR